VLQAIVHWSIHNRAAVLVLAALLLAAGVYATLDARLDVFPEFAPPQVVIQTEAPGLAPVQVEQLITGPIENAVHGIPRLATLRSQSIQGLSVVTVVFQDGTDVYRARQQVNERLGELAGQLPPEVKKPPRMAPLTSATGRLLTVGFTSDRLSPMDLRDQVQWNIRPQLLAIKGVAQVTIYGGAVRQFQVQLDPEALNARGLTVSDVLDAARQATGISGAGFQENTGQRTVLRVEGQIRSPRELGDTVVATVEGTPIFLHDVARVVLGPEPKFGDASVWDERVEQQENKRAPVRAAAVVGLAAAGPMTPLAELRPERVSKPAVVLVISKQLDEDTRRVTRHVEEKLDELAPQLAQLGITYHPALFKQANFIDHAVGNVTESLAIGAILVSVVLFLFLFNVRTAIISLTAIPLSLLSAVLVLWACGVGLNTLTLGGLAIAVGEVVDDAIIDVENIYRRLRENARKDRPQSALGVVLSASLEVRTAVVYATFIVVLVFVPVFFLSGIQGRLFAPLGYAYVLAVLASLAVALTVTPALSLLLLPSGVRSQESRVRSQESGVRSRERIPDPCPLTPDSCSDEPWLLRNVQRGYERLLRLCDREWPLVVTVTVVLIAAAGWALSQFGGAFLPELRENHFVVHMRGLPGTSLNLSMDAGERVTRLLRQEPKLGPLIRSIAQQAGRAELGEDTAGVEYNEIEVDLRPVGAEQAEEIQEQINEFLNRNIAGFSFEAMPFLKERISETLSGTLAQVAVKVYGDKLEAVDRAAERIAAMLGKIEGAKQVRIEPQTGAPELVVRPRWSGAARLGIRNAHLLDAMHSAFQGAEIGSVYDRNRIIDLTVVLGPGMRNDPEMIGNLWLNVPGAGASDVRQRKSDTGHVKSEVSEGRVQLRQVADVFLSDGRFLIAHEQGLRRQVVTCNVQGGDVEGFVRKATAAARSLPLPVGVSRPEFTGEHEARRQTQKQLLIWSLGAGTGVLLLLWLVFRSLRRLVLVLINLPFALVGGVAAVYLSGGNLNVGALVGFVTLFGITMRNSIMMVSHWQHLHEVEGMAWGPELVWRGARERLAPVLMTALVTGLGLLPIAVGTGEAGREIEGPMALVILGGLLTSTALNLLVLPLLYRRFGADVGSAPR
jgi:Cu/Ag efflux pump CusA